MDIDLTPMFKAQEGRTLASGYRLQKFIDCGAFGAVYRGGKVLGGAHIDRTDAIKLILPSRTEEFRRRQFDELRKLPGLEHPHIIRCRDVYECDTVETGAAPLPVLTLVMELAEGSLKDTLASLHGQAAFSGARIALAHQLGLHVAQALTFLEQKKSTVHQDIKPANILRVVLDGTEVWKLSDFGLVSTVGSGSYRDTFGANGTLSFMPPEAFPSRDQPKVKVSAKWDVWSLGCTLAEILTGGGAFSGTSTDEIIGKVCRGKPEITPSSLPAPFNHIVAGCLTIDRKQRWTAIDVVAALAQKQGGTIVTPLPPAETSMRPSLLRRSVLPLALASAMIGGVWYLMKDGGQNPSPSRQEAARVEPPKGPMPDELRRAEEAKRADMSRKAEEAARAEAAKKVEEARRRGEAAKAEAAKKAEQQRLVAQSTPIRQVPPPSYFEVLQRENTRLNDVYRTAKDALNESDRESLIAVQKVWLKNRDKKCGTIKISNRITKMDMWIAEISKDESKALCTIAETRRRADEIQAAFPRR